MKQFFFTLCMLYFCVVSFSQTNDNYKPNIPFWLVKLDTNLSWISKKKLCDDKEKVAIIKKLSRKKNIIHTLLTFHELTPDSLVRSSFLTDINHDHVNDFVLYDFIPTCDFKPYLLIAVSHNNNYEVVLQRECEVISWQTTNDTMAFQLFMQGCCGDFHGYIYTFYAIKGKENDLYNQLEILKKQTINSNTNPEIYWCYSYDNPPTIQRINNIEFVHDSIMLLPNPQTKGGYYESFKEDQYKILFFKGDYGEIMSEKTINNEKWYYLKMPLYKRNLPDNFCQGSYFYGWTSEKNVKIK
jgi:hypothetical protein